MYGQPSRDREQTFGQLSPRCQRSEQLRGELSYPDQWSADPPCDVTCAASPPRYSPLVHASAYILLMPPRDLLHPEACLNANLRRANRRVSQWYAQTIGDIGLEGTQFTLLATINGFGSCTLGQLAAWMGLEQSTATRSVELLRKSGLVHVRRSSTDARAREISLTGEGRARLEAAMPAWRQAQESAVAALGKSKATRLLAALHEIESVLSE